MQHACSKKSKRKRAQRPEPHAFRVGHETYTSRKIQVNKDRGPVLGWALALVTMSERHYSSKKYKIYSNRKTTDHPTMVRSLEKNRMC